MTSVQTSKLLEFQCKKFQWKKVKDFLTKDVWIKACSYASEVNELKRKILKFWKLSLEAKLKTKKYNLTGGGKKIAKNRILLKFIG